MSDRRNLWAFIVAIGLVLFLAPLLYWQLANRTLTAEQAGGEIYACPMHPEVQSRKPGERCHRCGMELVETIQEKTPPSPQPAAANNLHSVPIEQQSIGRAGRAASKGSQHSSETPSSPTLQQAPIRLSFTQQQLIGVTYGMVEKRVLTRGIYTVGRVEYDERKLAVITLKTAGWVQTLYINATGERVKKGQPLFTIYSPDLVTAQEEYLLALRTRKGLKASRVPGAVESAEALVRVSRNRLQLWDLTPQQIRELEATGEAKLYQTIYSPAGGFVIDKMVYQGQWVEPGTTLYKVADLSTIWVHADIYEYQLPFIRKGQEAAITFTYYPGAQWRGTVDYIYPYLDTQTRTNKVRFVFPNPHVRLKPGMYADMNLKVDLGERLSVPESAILHSGVRKLVFLSRGQGRLEPREVTLGVKADEYWEVLNGLREGERIVTNANFLIDSESKLAAAESMMSMMGAIGMGDWKMEGAKPMEMGGETVAMTGPQAKTVGGLRLHVSTEPGPATLGNNTLRIEVKDTQGNPVTDATIALEYTMDMPGMMINEAVAPHIGKGIYEAPVRFTMAGPWGVTVSVRRSGQAEVRERFTVSVIQ